MNTAVIGKKIKEYLLPIILVMGIFMLITYFIFKFLDPKYFNSNINSFKELFGIALAILSSGIFLAVLKWFQFMGFFREELQRIISSSQFDQKLQKTFFDVLYSEEFLKKQQNLDEIWRRVTRCFFKSEFPDEVSDKVNAKLGNVFFHNSQLSHFFRNYIVTIHIDLNENDYLHIEEITEVKVIRPNTSKFIHDFKFYIEKTNLKDTISSVKYNSILVNKQPVDLIKLVAEEIEGNKLIKKVKLDLEGHKEYDVVAHVTLNYNINTDYEYKFFSERVIDYIRISINHSKNLQVIFLPIGSENFENVSINGGDINKVYKDLLLPEKGFRLIFVKK